MSHLTEEQLNEYVDHLLTSSEAEEVVHHLLGCTLCQKKAVELQQVFTALADLPDVPLNMDLATRVLHLVELPPQTLPESFQLRVLPRCVGGTVWIIAALQIPLAGLTLSYAWPMLRAWLVPIESFFTKPWQELSLNTWLTVWWIGLKSSGMIQSILARINHIEQAIDYLHTQPYNTNWSTSEGILILVILLTAWAIGNYLLFNLKRKNI